MLIYGSRINGSCHADTDRRTDNMSSDRGSVPDPKLVQEAQLPQRNSASAAHMEGG